MAICVQNMRPWSVSQVCRAFVTTMENNFQMTERFDNGRPFATTPCGHFLGRRVKSPKWRMSTLQPDKKSIIKIRQDGQLSIVKKRNHGVFNQVTKW